MPDGLLATIRERWRLWRTPRTRVRDLADGAIVKVVGHARAIGEPLLGPFSGRELAALRVRGVRTEAGARQRSVRLLDDVEKGHELLVDDGTGVVRVDRAGYSRLFVPALRVADESPAFRENIERYFERYGQHERTFFDGFYADLAVRIDYTEWGVAQGAEVAVWGRARETDEPAAGGGYRHVSRLFVLEPPERDRLLISEQPAHRR